MNTSEGTGKIIAALVAIQEDMHVNKDGKNPHFKSKYATLDNILDTIKPTLKNSGLVVLQGCKTDERKIDCTTRVFHTSGEWIESVATVYADKGTPQGYGSAITYARRYGLATTLGIGLMDDDDANGAEKAANEAEVKAQKLADLEKYRKTFARSMKKYDTEIIIAEFENDGCSTKNGDRDDIIDDLSSQLDSREKLQNVGLRIKNAQDKKSLDNVGS